MPAYIQSLNTHKHTQTGKCCHFETEQGRDEQNCW